MEGAREDGDDPLVTTLLLASLMHFVSAGDSVSEYEACEGGGVHRSKC